MAVGNPIDNQIINVTRTIYASYLQTFNYLGLKNFRVIPNTTQNQKLGIQDGINPASGQMPSAQYLMIGNKGHYFVKASDGSDETEANRFYAKYAGLYGMIPFVLREPNDDLPAVRRRDYRLRRLETHNGKPYIAYYAKRFDTSLVIPTLVEITVIDGVETPKPYVPSVDDLNPVPKNIPNTGTVLGSNENISSSAIVDIHLTAEDIVEIIAAHRIRTGSSRSPIISELGICSGVDKLVDASAGAGGSFQYTEVIACQLNVHIATNHPIGYNTNGLELTFDIGGTEPMLGDTVKNNATFLVK